MILNFDPALLAVPNHASSQDEAEEIISCLKYWARPCFFTGAFRGLLPSDTLTFLADNGFFPSPPNISKLLDSWNLRHVYSTEDVRRSINFILSRSQSVEDVIDVEVTAAELRQSMPDISQYQARPVLFEATLRLLVTLALQRLTSKPDACGNIVISSFTRHLGIVSIQATANSGAVLSSVGEVHFPLSTTHSVLLADDIRDIALSVGASALWSRALDAAGLHFAIVAEILQIAISGGSAKTLAVPSFRVGAGFFETAQRHGAVGADAANADLLRETCARIVMGQPKNEIGDLKRADAKGDLKPVVRTSDGAAARRTHLLKSHEALRLMFWEHKDGTVEFANVGPKGELEIVDGSSGYVSEDDCWSHPS
ncbi:hypothetical protein RPMA_07165 [Tardiphaga alba]|uniref:Uncharacterized protein n=1 Tax=Tardiphaga alba TaxID=340268 RepID=A0ABX8A4M2_9BRAD|nr:hypothetical protein [Tardiphaga alba]QUS38639.1 hypothetical protein RPMA_07165 [Tardiphaga alba]